MDDVAQLKSDDLVFFQQPCQWIVLGL